MADAALDNTLYVAPVPEIDLRNFIKSAKSVRGSSKLDGVLSALIDTAYDPGISTSHRVAATDAICSFIKSSDGIVAQELYVKAFSVFLERADGARGKSMRQYLTALISTLKKINVGREHTVQHVLAQAFLTLRDQSSHATKIKPACQVLSIFLKEKVVDTQHVEAYLCQVDDKLTLKSFVKILFDWVRFAETAPVAGQTICALIHANPGFSWTAAVLQSVRDYPEILVNLRHHVFPMLFMAHGVDYLAYLKELGLHVLPLPRPGAMIQDIRPRGYLGRDSPDTTEKKGLLLASLQVGKEVGLVLDHCKHTPDFIVEISSNRVHRLDLDCVSVNSELLVSLNYIMLEFPVLSLNALRLKTFSMHNIVERP
jgi:hypothetical protein